jgi:hypothetical protein
MIAQRFDPSNLQDSLKSWETQMNTDTKKLEQMNATNDFADAICCAIETMSGEEVFECFFEAAKEHYEYANKEYKKASVLLNLASAYSVNKVKDINLD